MRSLMPDRPSFAKDYPKELDDLVAAFKAGNYARVRREAAKIADSEGTEAQKRAARDLAARTSPDKTQLLLLAIALLLLVGLSAYWLTHQKAPKTPDKNAVATSAVETPR